MSKHFIPTPSDSWSVRFYRQLMRIYPREFTASFGAPVDQAFRDLARDAFRDRGHLGLLLLWFRILPDFVFSAVELFTARAGDFLKWGFRMRWVVACSLGFAVGTWLPTFLFPLNLTRELSGFSVWLVLGLLQSCVLTDRYCSRIRWILFSSVGAVLAAGIARAIVPEPSAVATLMPITTIPLLNFPALIVGALIGLLQWQAFRKGPLNVSRWILASSAGLYAYWLYNVESFSLVTHLFQRAGDLIGFGSFNLFLVGTFINNLVAGAMFGGITAVPLARILGVQPVPTESSSSQLQPE